jgi:hypothetical protein
MDNAEALRALDKIIDRLHKCGIEDEYDMALKLYAHLTDPSYVRVPVDPTAKMLSAGYSARQETLKRFALGGAIAPADDGMKAAYRAMLAAATEGNNHD